MQRWGLQGVKSRGRGKPEKILCAKPYVSSPLGRNPTELKNNLEGKQPGEQGDCIFVPVIVFYLNCMERQNPDML